MSRHKTNRLGPPLGEGAGRVADRLGAREPRSGSAGDIHVSSLPTWAIWSIAVAALLSPVLAFLIAIAVEILIGSVTDAGVPLLLTLAVAGALSWILLRMRSPRLRGEASVQT